MKKEDLRLLIGYGEGYYSDSSKQWAIAYDVNDYEMLKEKIDEFQDGYTPCFCGLDGKYSEVEGEVDIEEDLLSIIKEYHNSDYDQFDDSVKYEIEKDSEEYLALKKAQDFIKKFKITTKHVNKYTGEEIDINDYKVEEFVVEK